MHHPTASTTHPGGAKTPQPLPAHSPQLRTARVEVWAGRRGHVPGTWCQTGHTARFRNMADALAYVDTLPNDENHALVNLTGYHAADGWKAHGNNMPTRRDGEWTHRPELVAS